ncbi:MAG: methionine--tRNA ligase, partial [Sphingobacteriia bacterium]|nr:methionine--tRNA ligase [Sphingobacteriia bacterium]
LECIEKFGTDAFRYFMMREMSVGHDCDFIPERFATRYTADLGNDLGNLLSRLLNMGQRYCDGIIPQSTINEQQEIALKTLWAETAEAAINDYDNLCFNCALEKIFFFISAINRYIETRAPWQLAKSQDETDKQRLITTLGVTAEALRLATVLLQPVMPSVCTKILSSLGINETLQFEGNLEWSNCLVGKHFGDKIILFPRLECDDKCK